MNNIVLNKFIVPFQRQTRQRCSWAWVVPFAQAAQSTMTAGESAWAVYSLLVAVLPPSLQSRHRCGIWLVPLVVGVPVQWPWLLQWGRSVLRGRLSIVEVLRVARLIKHGVRWHEICSILGQALVSRCWNVWIVITGDVICFMTETS